MEEKLYGGCGGTFDVMQGYLRDKDGDGDPDAFELFYNGHLNGNSLPTLDSDHDGVADFIEEAVYAEYVGTVADVLTIADSLAYDHNGNGRADYIDLIAEALVSKKSNKINNVKSAVQTAAKELGIAPSRITVANGEILLDGTFIGNVGDTGPEIAQQLEQAAQSTTQETKSNKPLNATDRKKG